MRIHLMAMAAVTCLTPAAVSASTLDVNLSLRLDSMTTEGVSVWDPDTGNEIRLPKLDLSADPYGIEHPFRGLSLGETLKFKTKIDPLALGGGGQASDCMIGAYDCSTTDFFGFATTDGERFALADADDDFFSIDGQTTPGSSVTFTWCNGALCTYSDPSGLEAVFDDVTYRMTVLPHDTRRPSAGAAVVPLPASLPMLAAGLLGLVWLRRRAGTSARLK